MKGSNHIINGIWHNSTPGSIEITINNERGPISIDGDGSTLQMEMQLSDLLMLSLRLTDADGVSSEPMLLWEDPHAETKVILQQVQRNGIWEKVRVISAVKVPTAYLFHIIEGIDGLLIVGTVELIDPDSNA